MLTLAIIGYLSISFAITYLFFRYINKKSRSPKKALFSITFCSTLIFGLLCLAISGPYLDTGIKEQRDKVQAANTALSAENQKLKAEQSKLKKEISHLQSEITAFEGQITALETEKGEIAANKTSLDQQVSDLTTANTNLENQVQKLQEKLTNISALTAAN
jgi:cell division protein FtsB